MNFELNEPSYPATRVVDGYLSYMGTPYGQLPEHEKLKVRQHINEKRSLTQNR